MSGIVGILHLDRRPVDQELLEKMTLSMTFRGPDRQNIWLDGHIGFGHTLLRTTIEAETEQQPCTLDGQVWIVADARIDARDELIAKLHAKGVRADLNHLPDVQLILYAYQVWGETCVDHLIGDFAFALWDANSQQLLCVRDQFGIKPFFYVHQGNLLVFSNTLTCLHQHPATTKRLNEAAIGDFLLFDSNYDLSTTYFADIQRLPPAHSLVIKADRSMKIFPYWSLAIKDSVRYSNTTDYIDRFRELFTIAVGDRLRIKSIGVRMSGGLDSTAIAAIAHTQLNQQFSSFDIRAHTIVYDSLIPDRERYYAALAAKSLKIPFHPIAADHYKPFAAWEIAHYRFSLFSNPLQSVSDDLLNQIGNWSRIALSGLGGDPALYPCKTYLLHLLKTHQIGHLLTDVSLTMKLTKRLPPLYLRSQLRRWLKGSSSNATIPQWINKCFASQYGLFERLRDKARDRDDFGSDYAYKIEALYRLSRPIWADLFEQNDPGNNGILVESRHPFFDLRLLKFILAIPAIPWSLNKKILRSVMQDHLPHQVVQRPKTPLAGFPGHILVVNSVNRSWLKSLLEEQHLDQFVCRAQLLKAIDALDQIGLQEYYHIIRVIALASWLQRQDS